MEDLMIVILNILKLILCIVEVIAIAICINVLQDIFKGDKKK